MAVACCRRVPDLESIKTLKEAIRVVEAFADNKASTAQLARARSKVVRLRRQPHRDWKFTLAWGVENATTETYSFVNSMRTAMWAAGEVIRRKYHRPEGTHQCDLCRDIFGNPFRPVTIDVSWLTTTVRNVARSIYEEAAFEGLPILADALEDAGCFDHDLLAHLRGPGPHVRGCFVLDALLGFQ